MRYVIALVVVAALLAACGDDEPSQQPAEKSPVPRYAQAPEPVGRLPEGVLLVQKESQSSTTFGIAADDSVVEYRGDVYFVASPDARRAAFARRGDAGQPVGVGIVTADGDEVFQAEAPDPGRELTPDDAVAFPTLLWAPDGSQLAYTLPDEAKPTLSHVYAVDADGSNERRITGSADYYYVVGWTGDGQVLVHGGEAGLVLMGAKCRELAMPGDVQVYGEFKLSPDSRNVAFLAGDFEQGFEVWVLDIQTGASRRVAEMGGAVARTEPERYVSARIPLGAKPVDTDNLLLKGPPPLSWSPDGRRIAYQRSETDASGAYVAELRVVDIETGSDVGVTRDPSWEARWSPDGRYLAAVRGQGAIVLLRPDGSTAVLDVPGLGQNALWSRDGTLVVATSRGIRLVDPDTGEAREALTSDGKNLYGAQLYEPVWSPDGRYLALATGADFGWANGSLYVLDTQTGALKLVLDEGSFQPVGWLRG